MAKLNRLKFIILASVLVIIGLLASRANLPDPTARSAPLAVVQNNTSVAADDLEYRQDHTPVLAAAPYQSLPYLTINVDITDAGIQPTSIYMPVGQSVLLVMRNRGSYEHHFHISGLVPADMLWFSRETGGMGEDNIDAADHSDHNHGGEMLPYHLCSQSQSGLCPTSNAVHTHAGAGDIDAILFTATNTGTFSAQDPLHPEIEGKVIVY